ncbi:MAG: ATP-dependent DNA helicase, partial [Eubacterium sp.]|nr:ATP-dependent DNA helicase [Eubacterium sp.]
MSEELEEVKISVRNLVEFIFREGDIRSGGSGARDTEAMQMGSRIHRKIQKSMGLGYEAEVPLFHVEKLRSQEFDRDFELLIEGRADGVFRQGDQVLVDEIKGVFLDLEDMKEPVGVHRAQALTYAYMILSREKLEEIQIQLTYCHMETEKIRRFQETWSREELQAWFQNLMDLYRPWAIYQFDWAKKRNASLLALEFPFDYRPGQKGLAAMVYRTIEQKDRLFIQAPTGVGKTITSIFPALKAMGQGLTGRIFYLTAKTITRRVAEECFGLLEERGLVFKPVSLTAKEKACFQEEVSCNATDCPYARGHYDRVNEAVYELLTSGKALQRENLLECAKRHQVCPFEMTLDLAVFADAVICDYNYVFDPNVYLRRFFPQDKGGDMVFLVDEAHNLVERGRDMYSARLVKEDLLAVKRVVKAMEKEEKRPEVAYNLRKYQRILENLNKSMLAYKRQCPEFQVLDNLGTMEFQILRALTAYELLAKDYPQMPERDQMLSLYFDLRNFARVLENMDEKFQIYASYTGEGNFFIKLQCMDPSTCLQEVFDRGRAAILFSATLLPIRYYKDQLGRGEEDPAVYATSVFSPLRRKVMIARDVTSKYSRRGPREYQKIADYIVNFVSAKQGNYLVFFPSYAFMDQVVERLPRKQGLRILVQTGDMREREKEEFLEAFEEETKDSLVGCCVLGGIFSEGIDLKEDRLIGAVIVGTGLPMVCRERELFQNYYQEKKGRGFDYAYLYPGINKV